jgi:hypothetical protein
MERCSCFEVLPGNRAPRLQSRAAYIPDSAPPRLGCFIGRGITREAGFFPGHCLREKRSSSRCSMTLLWEYCPVRLGIHHRRSVFRACCGTSSEMISGGGTENVWRRPLPAVFVISSVRRIDFCFARPGFSIATDPDEAVSVLTRRDSLMIAIQLFQNPGRERSSAKCGRG